MGYLSDWGNPWILVLSYALHDFSYNFRTLGRFLALFRWTAGFWNRIRKHRGRLEQPVDRLCPPSGQYGARPQPHSSTRFKTLNIDDEPAMSTTLYGYLLLTRGLGNIMSAPISAKLYSQPHNITSGPGNTGFDVGYGRFEKMIIYVGTCFAGAAGVAALGLAMDVRKGRQVPGNRVSE
jgi:hypothetical protein